MFEALRPITLILICLAWSGSAVSSLGAGLMENREYITARQALDDGLPEVAAIKATRLLEQSVWDSMERSTLAALAVEGWLQVKNGNRALEVLSHEDIPRKVVLEAQAQYLMGDYAAAETLLSPRMTMRNVPDAERLLLAQIYLAQGKLTQTKETLRPVLKSSRTEIARKAQLMRMELDLAAKKYAQVADANALQEEPDAFVAHELMLRARALVELGRHGEAQDTLRDVLTNTTGSEHIHHAAAILLADSLFRQGRAMESVEALVQFLDNTLESALWPEAFELLVKTLTREKKLSPPSAVLRWVAEGNTVQHALQSEEEAPAPFIDTFRGHSMLLVGRWLMFQQRNLEALGILEAMLQLLPKHPQISEAMRLALEMYGNLAMDDRVKMLAEQWRQRYGASNAALVENVTGSTAFARGDYRRSATLFQSAAELATSLGERRSALFNAGVAALKAGEQALYLTILSKLAVVTESSPQTRIQSQDGAADLELAKALNDASQQRPEAQTALREFIQKYPNHPRVAEAYIALAEWLLLLTNPDYAAIDKVLSDVSSRQEITPEHKEHIDYILLWRMDKEGNLRGLADAGNKFLTSWPNSPRSPEVRMKLADSYFRQGNFASARTEFELVAKEYASSPYADTALYFAGLSALSILSDEGRETAINLWKELGERGGPLSIPARQQQAMAKRRTGQEAEALKLMDSLLTEKTLSEELRRSLICEKAEMLIVQGKTNPTYLNDAVQVLTELRDSGNLPYFWRARIGYTLAAALNQAGRQSEAMEACYDVVQGQAQGQGGDGPSNPAEYRWYYKAGFFGIDLFSAAKQWESAARLAEKLAASKGDRATEAKERATTIRLEHFLWDGPNTGK